MPEVDKAMPEETNDKELIQTPPEMAKEAVEDSTMVLNDQEELVSSDESPFQKMEEDTVSGSNLNSLEILFDLELPVSVELAHKNVLISDILQLGEGSILEFDKMAGEPVDLLVNNKKIAEGEVVVIDDRFGIRVTNLLDPSERVKGLQ